MTFRDDHDAALARAAALEAELERERERADAEAREAAKLRRERDALEVKVARLEDGTSANESPRPVDADRVRSFRPKAVGERQMLILSGVAFVLIVMLSLALVQCHW